MRAWPGPGVGRGVDGLRKRAVAGPEPFLMSGFFCEWCCLVSAGWRGLGGDLAGGGMGYGWMDGG